MAWGAPILSSDGQVSLFALDDVYGETPNYTLQALASPPSLPLWLTLVGRAYLVSSEEAFSNNGILFRYLGRDVPAGYEDDLTVYYLPTGATEWQRLMTELDTYQNHASAMMPGTGLYALAATIEMPPFSVGWNGFGYPIPGSRPVTEALASIEGAYTSIYHFTDTQNPGWRLYDQTVQSDQPALADYLNDLTVLEFGHAYWIAVTKPVTLYLGVPGSSQNILQSGPQAVTNLKLPPATFYGYVEGTNLFQPEIGMPVTVWIDGHLCGETEVETYQEQLVYKVHVMAETLLGEPNGCGQEDKVVSFHVDEQVMASSHAWSNAQTWYFPLKFEEEEGFQVLLPMIVK